MEQMNSHAPCILVLLAFKFQHCSVTAVEHSDQSLLVNDCCGWQNLKIKWIQFLPPACFKCSYSLCALVTADYLASCLCQFFSHCCPWQNSHWSNWKQFLAFLLLCSWHNRCNRNMDFLGASHIPAPPLKKWFYIHNPSCQLFHIKKRYIFGLLNKIS